MTAATKHRLGVSLFAAGVTLCAAALLSGIACSGEPAMAQARSLLFADSFETGDTSCWTSAGCVAPKPPKPPAPQTNGPCPAGTRKVRRIEGDVPCAEDWISKTRVYEIDGAYLCDGKRVETREKVIYTLPEWRHVCGGSR